MAGEKLGQLLDSVGGIVVYVTNRGLNFRIPYTFEGEAANYVPDLIVRYDDGGVEPLNLTRAHVAALELG